MAMWEVFTSSKSCKTKDTVKSPKFMPFFIIFQSHSMHLFSVFSGLFLVPDFMFETSGLQKQIYV